MYEGLRRSIKVYDRCKYTAGMWDNKATSLCCTETKQKNFMHSLNRISAGGVVITPLTRCVIKVKPD